MRELARSWLSPASLLLGMRQSVGQLVSLVEDTLKLGPLRLLEFVHDDLEVVWLDGLVTIEFRFVTH